MKMEDECQVDLSSEWELCPESEDLFLDLSGDLDCLLDQLGFTIDLLFLGSFFEGLSTVWLISPL